MRNQLTSSMLLLAALACGTADESGLAEDSASPVVTSLASPAGPGSAQPFVSSAEDGVWMSWLQADSAGGHGLWVARSGESGWGPPRLVARSERFFVNWADFPSVTADGGGRLWAHWLARGGAGGYDYGVRVAHSDDDGATWSEPWTPHADDSPQEHGFVSLLPMGEGIGLSWLDGRRYSDGSEGPATREMTVRFRTTDGEAQGPEFLLDGRACDCCQTDAAMTADGPVVVYRDRTENEIRDIAIVRFVDGAWTGGRPVHDDGWEIAGCPVNGPAVVADGRRVAVAWFTAANDVPRVKVAFSTDGGASFGDPVVVDDGNPAGRVDLLSLDDGAVLVSWLERTGGEDAEVRIRRVRPESGAEPAATVAASGAARGSGFPRMARSGDGGVVLAWTDLSDEGPSRIHLARVEGVQ